MNEGGFIVAKKQATNLEAELRDLGTHANGATHMHETRETATPQVINAPVVPNPGPYDTRTGNYK